MHWCPLCGKPCFCDQDDTDMGEYMPPDCTHECEDDQDDEEFEEENEEEE